MKYVYFVSPNENSFSIYKMKVSDDFDFNNTSTIRTGYNDPYEMRSQYLDKPWWSNNFEDIRVILEGRKKKRIAKIYETMAELMKESFTRERCIDHDGRICPL